MAAVYRAFYALNRNPRINSKGLNTSCVLGFATTLYDLLRSLHPSHAGVAFDLQKPTFRHEMYAEYKANRDAMPEEIEMGLPWVKRLIEDFRIPILTCEGFEADDVIGTLSHKAEMAGFDQVIMVTPDKDFAQLVTPCVRMYRFGRMGRPDQIMGVDEVKERFSVAHPRQVIDLLGLWGDASDNIPGIPGVGEKTAKKLIDQFGSIEEMVRRSNEIKNDKLRLLVQQHADDALFSKQLATIALDAPIAFDEQQLSLKEPNYQALKETTDYLEFRQFARKVFSAATTIHAPQPASPSPTLFDLPQPSSPSTNHLALNSLHPTLSHNPLTPDTLLALADKDLAILFDGPSLLLSTDADTVFSSTVDKLGSLHAPLISLLANPATTKLCFDLKNLRYILAELNVDMHGYIFDVQLAHYLIDPELRHSLPFICSSTLGFEPLDAPSSAAALWQLFPLLVAKLRDAKLEHLYRDVELPLVDVLVDIERQGVRIDVDALRLYSRQLTTERASIEEQIFSLAGQHFNISSPKQLGEILYQKLKVTDNPPRTATKQFSTAEDVLAKLADTHPIIPLILHYRSISKLLGTYLDSFPRLINPATGRLHTVYNQTVTATGRLSSSNPNLQNIPIRTDRGREIRRAFVPRDIDHLLLAADYSQIELRIIASLAQDPHLLQAFANGLDIHAATAAKIYHLPLADVSTDQRRNAKSVNFGIVYGISPFGLSEQLSIPRKEAAALIDEYFSQYPHIRRFIDHSINLARQRGYAQTLLGRRRYLPDINSRNASSRSFAERNAVNMPIQGTSADMIKIAMVNIHRALLQQKLRSRIILQVHDELVLDLYRPEEALVRQIVAREMKQALPLPGIDIQVSIDVGTNWLQAH